MFLDRRGDGDALALQQRVFAAHGALQFRELADHFGLQIGLGQHRRALGLRRLGTNDRRDLGCQPADALDAFALRAKLGVESDVEVIEPRHALVEWLFQIETELGRRTLQRAKVRQIALIGVPEIERVRQARTHHLAVAMRDLGAAILRLDVGGEDEAVGQVLRLTLRAGDETLLVGADGEADHFRRNGQKVLLEFAHQDDRPFDQAGNFLQQALVLDKVEPVGEGKVAGVGQDDLLAPLGVDDDLGRVAA